MYWSAPWTQWLFVTMSPSGDTNDALQPQLDWCDARDLVSVARRAVGDALAGRPVQVDIPAGLPLVRADAVLMEQVLSNLLLNAALHTPAGTRVFGRKSVQTDRARRGENKTQQRLDRRAFSRAVGPQKSKNLALADFKINPVDGGKITDFFFEVLDAHGYIIHL